MDRTHLCTAIVTTVCLVAAPLAGTLVASEPPGSIRSEQPLSARPPAPRSLFTVSDDVLMDVSSGTPDGSRGATGAVADSRQWGGHHHHGHGGHNDGAQTALILGTIGAIAGTAVLIYASRPECDVFPNRGGCTYGAKVFGGSVLAAGIAGIVIGAATWR